MAETSTTKPRTRKAATPKAETPAPEGAGRGKLNQLKNKLRNDAEREVLRNHRDEVIALTKAKFEKAGIEYVHRLTPEEKAKKEVEDQLNQFPELREQFESELAAKIKAELLAELQEQQQAQEAGPVYDAPEQVDHVEGPEFGYGLPDPDDEPDFNERPADYYEDAVVAPPTTEQLRG